MEFVCKILYENKPNTAAVEQSMLVADQDDLMLIRADRIYCSEKLIIGL